MTNIAHKSLKLELKVDAELRRISGYASTFGNVDSVGDVVVAGAYMDSLRVRMPKMLYQHDSDDLVGVWDVAREDVSGLYVEGRIAKTLLGDEVLELAKMGALDAMSIGYSVVESEYDAKGVRILKKVDLYEVSFVTFPANPEAKITGVKSAPDNERDFEICLREAGYSRDAAKIIINQGFKALPRQREAGASDIEKAATQLADFLHKLKH